MLLEPLMDKFKLVVSEENNLENLENLDVIIDKNFGNFGQSWTGRKEKAYTQRAQC